MTLNKSPCDKDCKDRNIGCHSKCDEYIEWQRESQERKAAIKKLKKSIADVETYVITQKQKNMKARRR